MYSSRKTNVTGEKVLETIELMLKGLPKDMNKTEIIVACYTIVLLAQNPNLTTEQLVKGVSDISAYVSFWINEQDLQLGDKVN